MTRPSRGNAGTGSGYHKSRQHRWCAGQGQLTWLDGSTNSWRHARTQDHSHGGQYSYSRGPPQHWTSMRDTCGTSGNDRCSLVRIPPRKPCYLLELYRTQLTSSGMK